MGWGGGWSPAQSGGFIDASTAGTVVTAGIRLRVQNVKMKVGFKYELQSFPALGLQVSYFEPKILICNGQ